MKKIILISLLLFNTNVMAKEVEEEIIPLRNSRGEIIKFKDTINIPKEINDKEIIIKSNIFDTISHYKNIKDINNLELVFKINNKSKYNYSYSSKRISINKLNYQDEKYYPYRSLNKALVFLVHNKDISDDSLDRELKVLGYHGIEDLNKYYYDFYNTKKLNYQDIFSGEVTNYKETNRKLVKLAYDNFYNNVLVINDKKLNIHNYNDIYNNYSLNIKFTIKLKKAS